MEGEVKMEPGPVKQNSAALVGDASLFTAAAFCILLVAFPLALVIGLAAAWLLHNRRIDRAAVISGVISMVISALLIGGFLLLLPLAVNASSSSGGSELFLPIILLSALGTAFLFIVLMLDVEALRDLRPGRRKHPRLDISRLASTLVLLVFTLVVILVQVFRPQTEMGEAGVFLLAAALVGAVTMLVAQAIRARLEQRCAAARKI
jgi:RsiW-degrading membrane proteinase PrsW (M82 family)